MTKSNEVGALNVLLIPLILAIILLIAAIAFGGWAYSSRQDYKNNSDAKAAAAVTIAKQQEGTLKDEQFTQAEKLPLKAYNGPQAFGSVIVNYPKTWSSYVDDNGGNGSPVDGYFYPGTVPSITDQNSTFALRIQVLAQTYSTTLSAYSGEQQNGLATIAPYALPRVPSVIGAQVTGLLQNGKSGVVVVLPLRASTLEIWTEGNQFTNDFNNIILPNFIFSP